MKAPHLFARYYPLRGKRWLRGVDPIDRKALSDLGRSSMRSPATFQSEGGQARSATARRDRRGRFTKET